MAVDPAITGTEQTALNGASTCRAFLSVVPFTTPVATASVTATPSGGTLTELTVGSTSGWSDVKPGMTVLVKDGSTVRARFRVRKTPGASTLYVNETGFGDPGNVTIANTSTYILSGNSVEIHNTSDLWSVTPRIVYSGGTTGDIYEDYDATVGTFHTTPYPIVRIYATNSQNYTARHISSLVADSGTETITWTAVVEKWPTSIGSTLTYSWAVPGSWTGVTGNTTATLSATVPIGYHTLYLTTTDSIGGAFVSTCHVWVHDKTTFPPIRIAEIHNDTESQTDWRMSLRLVDDDIQSIPDGAMVNYWEMDTWNGSVPASNTFTHQRPGWIIRYQMTAEGGFKQTDPEIINPAGVLSLLGAYSQYIEANAVASTWQLAISPLMTMHFMVFTMLANRCGNLLRLFNYNPVATAVTSARMPVFKIDAAGSLLAQIQQLTRTYYGAQLGCDATGEFWFRKHPSLDLNANRSAIPTRITLTEARITPPFEVTREIRARVRKVRAEAFVYDGASGLPTPSLSDAYSNAPGQGVGEERLESQVLDSGQDDTNELGGHYIQMQNNPYPDVRVTIPKNWPIFKPAQLTYVQMNVAATYMPDGVAFNRKCVLKSVSRRHNADMTVDTVLTLEAETQGYPGVTVPIPPPGANSFPELPPLSILEPILTPPALIDYGGAFSYTPTALMTEDPTPGAAQNRGRFFICTTDCRVVRLIWDSGGSPSYSDISPTSTQRTTIGTVVGMVVDPFNLKRYYILGDAGVGWTNDITATTVTWKAQILPTNIDNADFSISSQGFSVMTTNDFNGGEYSSARWNVTNVGTFYRVSIEKAFTARTITNVSVVGFRTSAAGSPAGTVKVLDASRNVLGETNLSTAATGVLNFSVSGTFTSAAYVMVIIDQNTADPCYVSSVATTSNVSNTPFAAFQGVQNRRNTFYWLGKSGSDLYFNRTLNTFANVDGVQVESYSASTVHSLTVRSDNWRQIYVSAISGATRGIYKSFDGGVTFNRATATVNTNGGALWFNRSTGTRNVRNTSETNFRHVVGTDGSNNQQISKGLSGAAITVVATSANDYLQTERAFGFLASDLDFGWYLARTGVVYNTNDGGTTWTVAATITGGASFVVWGGFQYPTDSNFWGYFGYRALGYTTDFGVNWVSLWASYDTFRSGAYGGSVGETIASCAVDLSRRYPIPPT